MQQQIHTTTSPLPDMPADKKPSAYIKSTLKKVLKKNFNQQYCFLVDLSVPSGKKRFYIYDLTKDITIASGLVAHGSCNTAGLAKPKYSNEKGSGCSTLGKYKVGYKYHGKFGAAYKLYGLDSSNSNAFERAIVLHSYDCVPDYELIEAPVCNSLGCPMVSPNFFKQLEKIIDNSKKPVLLWMYEDVPTTGAYVLHP